MNPIRQEPANGNTVLNATKYETIDTDPHFKRVVRYFRASDWLNVAAFTAAGPAFFMINAYFRSGKRSFYIPARSWRMASTAGVVGGFLFAYTSSVNRFLGVTENAREVNKDRFEMKQRLSKGLSLYGVAEKSTLEPWLRRVAAKSSTNSSVAFALFPWFNLVHHEFHGVNPKKYLETRPGEEDWNFSLPSIEEVKF